MSCSMTQHSASDKSRTNNPSISSLLLNHCVYYDVFGHVCVYVVSSLLEFSNKAYHQNQESTDYSICNIMVLSFKVPALA